MDLTNIMYQQIIAKSSEGDGYEVDFHERDGQMTVFCHCQAGSFQKMCKHKSGLIRLDSLMLASPADSPLLKAIGTWSGYPKLFARLQDYELAISSLEREKTEIAKREKKLKTEIAYELTHGKPMS